MHNKNVELILEGNKSLKRSVTPMQPCERYRKATRMANRQSAKYAPAMHCFTKEQYFIYMMCVLTHSHFRQARPYIHTLDTPDMHVRAVCILNRCSPQKCAREREREEQKRLTL